MNTEGGGLSAIRILRLGVLLVMAALPAQSVTTLGRSHGLEWVWGHRAWHWGINRPRPQVMLHVREHGTRAIRARIHCLWVGLHRYSPVRYPCGTLGQMVWPLAFFGQGYLHSQPEWGYLLPQQNFRVVKGVDYLLQAASMPVQGACAGQLQVSSILRVRY